MDALASTCSICVCVPPLDRLFHSPCREAQIYNATPHPHSPNVRQNQIITKVTASCEGSLGKKEKLHANWFIR
ncbi:hypothetical protein IAD21_06414 (plasmid) [Abditibacteriota bacterium]|nr:hypothetical protein IAD21_06414 [Abditibacteriota bacterium]